MVWRLKNKCQLNYYIAILDIIILSIFYAGVASKTFKILETLSDELKEIKAYLHATRPPGLISKLDFTQIPTLPIITRQQLEEFEGWVSMDANKILLVQPFNF